MRRSRLYRSLLRLYPAEFRRRFGRDMEELFVDRISAARRAGRASYLRELVSASLDATSHAFAERWRHSRRNPMVSTLPQDIRYGLTVLRRSPGFAFLAIMSLGLGIGATTALYGAARIALMDE